METNNFYVARDLHVIQLDSLMFPVGTQSWSHQSWTKATRLVHTGATVTAEDDCYFSGGAKFLSKTL